MPFALWSIDTRDWRTHNIAKNIASIANVKSGDIIIMHDIHETSIASIPAIMTNLKARGFTFVTVSELLELSQDNQQIGKRCYKK
jgi:peptidoglycan-N-acetylglucosamine deacetylase